MLCLILLFHLPGLSQSHSQYAQQSQWGCHKQNVSLFSSLFCIKLVSCVVSIIDAVKLYFLIFRDGTFLLFLSLTAVTVIHSSTEITISPAPNRWITALFTIHTIYTSSELHGVLLLIGKTSAHSLLHSVHTTETLNRYCKKVLLLLTIRLISTLFPRDKKIQLKVPLKQFSPILH